MAEQPLRGCSGSREPTLQGEPHRSGTLDVCLKVWKTASDPRSLPNPVWPGDGHIPPGRRWTRRPGPGAPVENPRQRDQPRKGDSKSPHKDAETLPHLAARILSPNVHLPGKKTRELLSGELNHSENDAEADT